MSQSPIINPKMIPVLTKLFVQLAKLGVQLFISTHSYFLMQELGLFAEYENHDKLDIQFVSMFLEENEVKIETADQLKDLQHNVAGYLGCGTLKNGGCAEQKIKLLCVQKLDVDPFIDFNGYLYS